VSHYKKFLFIILSIFYIPNATAAILGTELLQNCQSFLAVSKGKETLNSNAVASGICVGYIEAIADFQDYLLIANSTSPQEYQSKQGLYCPPPDLTSNQAATVVVNYLSKSPKTTLSIPAASLVLNAFINAFPCK
jgi:hypothetical protein